MIQTRIEVVVCLLVLSIVVPALDQTSYATLGETASDGSGALIPGVTIKAANVQTGIVSETVSNESGVYHSPSVQSGSNRVSAELPRVFRPRFATDV